MEDLAGHLDILGQQASLYKLYTQLCLCFRMSDAASEIKIVATLNYGLEKLTASFPWVAGQVVHEQANDKISTYKLKPYTQIPLVVVKHSDEVSSLPIMNALREAKFPFSMLHESTVASINTFAAGTDSPAPVLQLQANFIPGGLLLTFVTQHNVMDMTGQAQIMYLLSKACHDEHFTNEELRIGNLDRRNLIPLLEESYTPGPELKYQIAQPTVAESISSEPKDESAPTNPPECKWTYFLFSGASLSKLKAQATATLPLSASESTSYISTDDVLSAFIWQSVTKARSPRLSATETTTFARAIDPRRYLDLPAAYPGLVQNMTYHTVPISELTQTPLGTLSWHFRTAVDPKTSNLGYATRALNTWFHRAEDKSTINVTATLDLSKDIMLSSWAKYTQCYDMDFNLGLGKPEAVRRPGFDPCESLFYLMPKAPSGEMAVALCLRDEDLQRLQEDEGFADVAQFIG